MSLLTVAELRAQVRTSLTDAQLQSVITREEAEVIRLYGAHYVVLTNVTETLAGGTRNLYLRRRIGTITSITEYATLEDTTGTLLTTAAYLLWADEGRIQRLPSTSIEGLSWGLQLWGARVTVIYIPFDDTDARKAAIIDLCRLALERTAMQSESVGGEYSYTAPNWAAARADILARLGFVSV